MARNTRERLIEAAHDLFFQSGFHTVGLDAILAEVGVTKTTFYNHFSSRDDLIVAVLQWDDEAWARECRQMLRDRAGDDPAAQLRALFPALRETMNADYPGCMFINAAVTFPSLHDPVHQAAARHKFTNQRIIQELAEQAGVAEPERLAKKLALLMEGAFVTFQLTRELDVADVAVEIVECLLDQALPPRRTRRSPAVGEPVA